MSALTRLSFKPGPRPGIFLPFHLYTMYTEKQVKSMTPKGYKLLTNEGTIYCRAYLKANAVDWLEQQARSLGHTEWDEATVTQGTMSINAPMADRLVSGPVCDSGTGQMVEMYSVVPN